MTREQIDAAWRSLPAIIKEQFATDYANALQAHSFDPNNPRIDAHIKFLEECFGKHNLTASKEEKPFKVGDRVYLSPSAPLKNRSRFGYLFVKLPSIIKELEGNKALISYFGYELRDVPVEHIIPYTEEQEPKNGECVDSSSSLQNEISSLSKEDAEELAKCLAEVNNFIERNQASQVDWLAYRMELAKEVVNGLLFTGKSPETIVDETVTIVNGLLERLKGGVSQ